MRQPGIAITPEEETGRDIGDLRRSLEGLAFREKHAAEVMPWEDALSAEQLARRREGLEAERQVIYSRLRALGVVSEPEQPSGKDAGEHDR